MKICPNCGNRYGDDHKFCSACGGLLEPLTEQPAALETPETPATAPETVPEAPVEESVKAETIESPAEETPVEPSEPEEKKKPRDKKKVGAGRRILAVLLSILLFVFLLTPALGYAVRRATTETGLQAVLENIKLSDLRVDPFFDDVDEELTMSELLSEDLAGTGLKIGESSVAKILNSSAMKSWLASQASQVFADVYAGRTRYEFDQEELVTELLEGKTSRVLQKEKVELSRSEAEGVAQLLTNYGLGDFLSRDSIKDDMPALNRAMNIGLSYAVIIGLLVLALAMIVLIFMVNRGTVGLSFGDIGGTALAVGLVLTLVSLFAKVFSKAWTSICGGSEAIAAVSAGVLFYNLRISLIMLGAGLVFTILGRLLRGRKADKQAET